MILIWIRNESDVSFRVTLVTGYRGTREEQVHLYVPVQLYSSYTTAICKKEWYYHFNIYNDVLIC